MTGDKISGGFTGSISTFDILNTYLSILNFQEVVIHGKMTVFSYPKNMDEGPQTANKRFLLITF